MIGKPVKPKDRNDDPGTPLGAVYHSFNRICGNESKTCFHGFPYRECWETVNDTRGNDLGHGNNDKDEKHTNTVF